MLFLKPFIFSYKSKMKKEFSGLFEEFLEEPLRDSLDEIDLRIEEINTDLKEALRDFDN
jgi:hypothetical protein